MSVKPRTLKVLRSTALRRARCAIQDGDWQAAAMYWGQVLDKDPTNLDALMGAALVSHKLATPRLDDGTLAQVLNGESLKDWQRRHLKAAVAFLVAATDAHPECVDAWYNLGTALHHLGHLSDAAAAYRKARELDPQRPDVLTNLGNVEAERGDRAEAEALYDEALALATPDSPTIRYHRSFLLLARGAWSEGWREHEQRLDSPTWQALHPRPDLDPAKRWDGTHTHHLLITSEQGYGDAIMFWRYVRAAASRGFNCTLETQPALLRLARFILSDTCRIVPKGEPVEHTAHVSIMSLPYVLGSHEPKQIGAYVHTHGARPIAFPGLDGLKVGIAWAGSPTHLNDRVRSATLADIAPLFELDGVSWVSLQVGRANGIDDYPVVNAAPALINFAATARVIAGLDAVVSVDTAVAHLAGAMGKPTVLMLPARCDWRWGTSGDRTPWYASMTLVRQRAVDDWPYAVSEAVRLIGERRDRQG